MCLHSTWVLLCQNGQVCWEGCEGLGGNLELEKLLSTQSSLNFCQNLEVNAESGADDGGLACEVSGVSEDLWGCSCAFGIKNLKFC